MDDHQLIDRLSRLAKRREDDGIYTDANLIESAIKRIEISRLPQPSGLAIHDKEITISFYSTKDARRAFDTIEFLTRD